MIEELAAGHRDTETPDCELFCSFSFLQPHITLTLQDSLAFFVSPAPRAFPTRTLAAADSPNGNYRRAWGKVGGGGSPLAPSSSCDARTVSTYFLFFFHHVGDNGQLVDDGLGAQLGLADHSGQEAPHLEQPPLQAQHEHAGDGQVDEGPPLLQALHGPACVEERARVA